MFIKMYGLGTRPYFHSSFNCFDCGVSVLAAAEPLSPHCLQAWPRRAETWAHLSKAREVRFHLERADSAGDRGRERDAPRGGGKNRDG